jgi:hypothetical protein
MRIPRAARDLERVHEELKSLLEDSGTLVTLDPVPTWRDGPTLSEVATSLSAAVGVCNLVQQDYLGAPYRIEAHRRAPTIEVRRELSPLTVAEAVLRLWAARGPILELGEDQRSTLVAIVETGGAYPMQRTMARLLLASDPALGADPAAVIAAIHAAGYERLWNDGFSALT